MNKIIDLINIIESSKEIRLDLLGYIPRTAIKREGYKGYSRLNDNQKRVFRIEKPKKDKLPYRLRVVLTPILFEKIITKKDFEKGIEFFERIIPKSIPFHVIARCHLDVKKYNTIPPLPAGIDRTSKKFGSPILSGIKLYFRKPKTILKSAFIDVSPCMRCGEVDAKINLFMKKESRISAKSILYFYEKVREYCKFFYEIKR